VTAAFPLLVVCNDSNNVIREIILHLLITQQMSKSNKKYLNVLKNLAIYKFLTLEQMVRLGVDNHKTNISTETATMIRDGHANKISKSDTSPAVYYLTRKGATRAEHIFDITPRYPKRKMDKMVDDMPHRLSIVDLHIEISRFNVIQHWREFDYVGVQRQKNLEKASKINLGRTSLVPDLIFKLNTDQGQRLYLAEVERTEGKTADKYYEDKVHKYITLLSNQAVIKRKFNVSLMYTVLFVIDDRKFIEKLKKKILKDKNAEKHNKKKLVESFLFKHFDDDVFTWTNLEGKPRLLFY